MKKKKIIIGTFFAIILLAVLSIRVFATGSSSDPVTSETLMGTSDVTVYAHWVKAVTEFAYTGNIQTFTASATGYYKFEAWGAQGGGTTSKPGGKGAYTSGYIYINKGDTYYIYVGQQGPSNASVTNVGGYNGGGYSGNNSGSNSYGGGGATDIRVTSGAWNDSTSLSSRIMVAAGGGGNVATTSYTTIPGDGGALTGISAQGNYSSTIPTGGTQIGKGQSHESTRGGYFGYAQQTNTSGWGGGGGSGYWGGSNGHGHSGSGGSSYISGHTGCVAIASAGNFNQETWTHCAGENGTCSFSGYAYVKYGANSSWYYGYHTNSVACTNGVWGDPASGVTKACYYQSAPAPRTGTGGASCTNGTTDNLCSIHYSGKSFINTVMNAGNESMPTHDGTSTMTGNTGNGYAKITYMGADITVVITLDEQNPTTSGTTSIYEVYDIGYYLDSSRTTKMTTIANGITKPTKAGYMFQGYYTEPNGGGTKYIGANGRITSQASAIHFSANGTLYAYWTEGSTITITASGSGDIQFLGTEYDGAMPDYVLVDGTSITPAKSYNFATGGDHTIVLKWNDPTSVTSMYRMFYKCSSLTSLDLSNFDTSNVTNMADTFYRNSSLTSLDLSNFDTSNVTNMSAMFYRCSSLTSLDLSSFDTSNVTIMESMLYRCSSLTSIDLSNFDTSNVTDMSYILSGSSNLTSIDLSNFDTSNVTTMYCMFAGCSSLTNLDLSNFNFSSVTDYSRMFEGVPNNIAIKSSSTACSWIASNSGITATNYTCTQQ